jgi:hypothetical protein
MLDYLDCRGEDLLENGLGGKSIPGTILAALMLMETMGQVDESAMICRNSAFIGAVNNWTMLLTRNHTTVRKANLPTLSLVMALELLFTNAEASLFMLSWAWLMLLKCWCVLRSDCLNGLDPVRVTLTSECLTLILCQSKTTGPGKRITEVPVFVHRLCSLTGVDWLAAGYKIWTSPTYSMPRDFFCLTADRGFNAPLKKLLTTGQMIAYDRRVFRALRVPLRDAETGVWAEGPDYLVSPEAASFWSGHSNRHWLPSVAATLGIPKSERDHLGRWGCTREGGSSDYLSTNRQIVLSSQYHVALALCVGARPGDPMKRSYCESELLESLRAHVDKAGHSGRDEAGKHRILLRTDAGWSLVQDFPTFEVAEEPMEAETDIVPLAVDPPSSEELWRVSAGSSSTAGSAEGALKGPSLYWVSISRKTGFRRLHHRHGCGTMEWHCHRVEQIQDLNDQVADAVCKQCQRYMDRKAVGTKDSSGASSSSMGPSNVMSDTTSSSGESSSSEQQEEALHETQAANMERLKSPPAEDPEWDTL